MREKEEILYAIVTSLKRLARKNIEQVKQLENITTIVFKNSVSKRTIADTAEFMRERCPGLANYTLFIGKKPNSVRALVCMHDLAEKSAMPVDERRKLTLDWMVFVSSSIRGSDEAKEFFDFAEGFLKKLRIPRGNDGAKLKLEGNLIALSEMFQFINNNQNCRNDRKMLRLETLISKKRRDFGISLPAIPLVNA